MRLGLYGSMLDKIMGAGYVVLRGDREMTTPQPTVKGNRGWW